MYYIKGSDLCAAIVQFYHPYYLYYLVLCVSFNLCAIYFYCVASPTQIIRALAALTQLVPATASHRPSPLRSQWWRSCSGANCCDPFPVGANLSQSIPPRSNQHPIHFICPIQLLANYPDQKMPVSTNKPKTNPNTIQPI